MPVESPKPTGGAFKFRQSSKALNFSQTNSSARTSSQSSKSTAADETIKAQAQPSLDPQPIKPILSTISTSVPVKSQLTFLHSDDDDDFAFISLEEKTKPKLKELLPKVTSTQSIESTFDEEFQKIIKSPTTIGKKPTETKSKVAVPKEQSPIDLNDESKNDTSHNVSSEFIDLSRSDQSVKTSVFKHRVAGSTQPVSNLQTCLDALEKTFEDIEVSSPKKTSIRPVSSSLMQLKKPELNSYAMGQTQLSPGKDISITIDPTLMNEVDRVTKDPTLNTCTVQRLRDEKFKFLEAYYKIMTQIPMTFFEPISGFSQTKVLKVKMAIESISGRITRIERTHKPPTQMMKKASPVGEDYSMNEDDQVDFNELMQNVSEARLADAGKSNSSYIDLSNMPSPLPTTSSNTFKPRVNMAMQSIHGNPMLQRPTPSPQQPYVHSTELIEDFETDDFGFPNIDYSQLVDVLPNSSASTASSTQSKKSQPTEKRVKETVDSMIPDSSSKVAIKNTNEIGNFHSNVQNDGITGEFDGFNYPFSVELQMSFKHVFGLREFRSNQLQSINAVMLGHDCFVLMPTGGGKSLCYQLPAVITNGVTIVVSPLKSLILDQVNKLKSLDVS